MDDEHTLREADARVRRALWPDDAVARRVLDVLDRAIADERAPRRRARGFQSAVVLAAALILCVTGVIVWQSRHAPSAPGPASSDSLAVTGTGSMVVVEHPDGRRWIVGPPPERRAGRNYVIVVQK